MLQNANSLKKLRNQASEVELLLAQFCLCFKHWSPT